MKIKNKKTAISAYFRAGFGDAPSADSLIVVHVLPEINDPRKSAPKTCNKQLEKILN